MNILRSIKSWLELRLRPRKNWRYRVNLNGPVVYNSKFVQKYGISDKPNGPVAMKGNEKP